MSYSSHSSSGSSNDDAIISIDRATAGFNSTHTFPTSNWLGAMLTKEGTTELIHKVAEVSCSQLVGRA